MTSLPLTALRAFDLAAQLGSFKEAAEALSISPPAVSQQIRALEKRLGVLLFTRSNRRVHLTDHGLELRAEVRPAMLRLEMVVDGFLVRRAS